MVYKRIELAIHVHLYTGDDLWTALTIQNKLGINLSGAPDLARFQQIYMYISCTGSSVKKAAVISEFMNHLLSTL